MKIVTWNVNSVKSRHDHVTKFLETRKPDILMLQELKGLDCPDFKAAGYECAAITQKAYNGVAVISKKPVKTILEKLPGDNADEQARYLEVETDGIRVIDIYLPNGNPIPGEKFDYKLRWMARLRERLKQLRNESIPFLVGGDFNVIPEDKDCYDPKAWIADALFQPESRAAFRSLLNLGLYDALRINNDNAGQYTYWDYQAAAWDRGNGIRIDHFLLSPEIADKLQSCIIDTEPRGWDKPSDHTPVIVEIAA
jgi:exodeoxyribonuclease-3